jgi:hypothetical protein
MILASNKSEPDHPVREYEVGFATKTLGASKSYALQVRLPRKLLGEIGDPKRILIEGKPAEGYIIRATNLKHEGHAVNYNLPGHSFFFHIAFKPTKLTKVIRRMTVAHARRDGDVIRVGGMPLGWIKGDDPFVGKTPKVALATDGGTRLPANPKSGALPRRPDPPPPPQPREEVAAITTRLNAALDTARVLRTALEQTTGLKFKVTQQLRLILAEK